MVGAQCLYLHITLNVIIYIFCNACYDGLFCAFVFTIQT